MRALRIAKTWGERGRRAICSLGEQQGTDPPDFGIGIRLGGVAGRGQGGVGNHLGEGGGGGERGQGGFGTDRGEGGGGGLSGRGRGKLHCAEERLFALLVVHPRERGGEDGRHLLVGGGESFQDALDASRHRKRKRGDDRLLRGLSREQIDEELRRFFSWMAGEEAE